VTRSPSASEPRQAARFQAAVESLEARHVGEPIMTGHAADLAPGSLPTATGRPAPKPAIVAPARMAGSSQEPGKVALVTSDLGGRCRDRKVRGYSSTPGGLEAAAISVYGLLEASGDARADGHRGETAGGGSHHRP
jgi:hypothetical protein